MNDFEKQMRELFGDSFTLIDLNMGADDIAPEQPVIFEPQDHRLGFIPGFLDLADPDDPITQIDKNYGHGGGWRDFDGFALTCVDGRYALEYPGDPSTPEISRAIFRDLTVVVFDYAWVAVFPSDDMSNFRVARID